MSDSTTDPTDRLAIVTESGEYEPDRDGSPALIGETIRRDRLEADRRRRRRLELEAPTIGHGIRLDPTDDRRPIGHRTAEGRP